MFRNTLEHRRELLDHLGAPGSASNMSGSACDKSGSTSNHSGAVQENNFVLESCWWAWKSWLLLIVQRLLNIIYSDCILIYISMYLCIYESI